ncbi:MAG: hypothetical protein OXQ29_09515 [Rhodospirillaceae bacterium]|nr:hypothetical protein [Rhodospirillaceae bacterium]
MLEVPGRAFLVPHATRSDRGRFANVRRDGGRDDGLLPEFASLANLIPACRTGSPG